MKQIICWLKGHNFIKIKETNLVEYPSKYVLVDGEPVVCDRFYGSVRYLTEKDYSKKPHNAGTEIILYCNKCGMFKKKEL